MIFQEPEGDLGFFSFVSKYGSIKSDRNQILMEQNMNKKIISCMMLGISTFLIIYLKEYISAYKDNLSFSDTFIYFFIISLVQRHPNSLASDSIL